MGESQWNLQSDVRAMSDIITREVRYASVIELSNHTPTFIGSGKIEYEKNQ